MTFSIILRSDPAGRDRVNLRDLIHILRHGVNLQGDLKDIFEDFVDLEEISFEQFMFSITNSSNEREN